MAVTEDQVQVGAMMLEEYAAFGDRDQLAVFDDLLAGAQGSLTRAEQDKLLFSSFDLALRELVGHEPRSMMLNLWGAMAEYFIIWPRMPGGRSRQGLLHLFKTRTPFEAQFALLRCRAEYQANFKKWEPSRWRTNALGTSVWTALAKLIAEERSDGLWQVVWEVDNDSACLDGEEPGNGGGQTLEFYRAMLYEVQPTADGEPVWLSEDPEFRRDAKILNSLGCVDMSGNMAVDRQHQVQVEQELMVDAALEQMREGWNAHPRRIPEVAELGRMRLVQPGLVELLLKLGV